MKFNASEQTVGWFKDMFVDGALDLRPPYQRKPVWRARQKCHLVESVFLDFPIPEVFVQRSTTPEGKSTYSVVDGQQRIRALLQFASSDNTDDAEEFNGFPLDKLDQSSDPHGKTLGELADAQRMKFFGYRLAVRWLDSMDEEEMKSMFRRLNRYTVPLTAQELRNATYEGPLARFVEKLAERYSDELAERGVLTAAAIRRMGDVEFIAELVIGLIHGPQGGSASSIDEYYLIYEDYDSEFPQQRRIAKAFENTWSVASEILCGEPSRWRNKTDFYSLFVALGSLEMRSKQVPSMSQLAPELQRFAEGVDVLIQMDLQKLQDLPTADDPMARYARSVVKGANDMSRESERNAALLAVFEGVAKD